jgi:hypothetical protein
MGILEFVDEEVMSSNNPYKKASSINHFHIQKGLSGGLDDPNPET